MGVSVTSVLLETDTVMPFSLGMLLELLFGELGPEPGALLHAESLKKQKKQNTHIRYSKHKIVRSNKPVFELQTLTCHVQGAFLGGGDGAVPAAQQRTAPALAHLLLQPGTQLQVGLRG